MNQVQLSANSKAILTALLAGPALSKDVASTAGMTVPAVTGSLATLKKGGFVEVLATKELKLTPAGTLMVQPATAIIEYAKPAIVVGAARHSKGDRKVAAAKIIDSMPGAKRKDVLARLMSELGMSEQGASTYHYNLAGAKGRWNANAA